VIVLDMLRDFAMCKVTQYCQNSDI